MKTVVIVVSLTTLLAIVYAAALKGLDLKRRSSWLYGAISLLSGVAIIIGLNGNLIDGLKMGVIFASLTLLTGAVMRRHNQKYRGMASSLIEQYGQEGDPSFFAKLVRKLLGRYK